MQGQSFGAAIQAIGSVITMVAVVSGWLSIWLAGGAEKRTKNWLLTKDGRYFMGAYIESLNFVRNEIRQRRQRDDESSDANGER